MLAYCGVVLMAAMLCARAGSRWQLGAQSLDTDLDSLLCSPRNYPGIIIDIRESMEKGAELLDGLWTKTVDGCLSGCCNTRGCDLALFKNEGASKTGKNCYYVHCGTVENCVMVQHSSFTTIALLNGKEGRKGGGGGGRLGVEEGGQGFIQGGGRRGLPPPPLLHQHKRWF